MKILGFIAASLIVLNICSAQEKLKFNTVLEHYKSDKDSLKLRAAKYLLKNIDSHKSIDLIWVDSKGNDTGSVSYTHLTLPTTPYV